MVSETLTITVSKGHGIYYLLWVIFLYPYRFYAGNREKTLFVIAIINKMRHYHEAFREVMESTPRNKEQYPETRVVYRILILTERIKGFTHR